MESEYISFYQNFNFDLLHKLTPYLANPLFNIEVDNGFAETYQHLKFVGIVIAFSYLCIKTKSWFFAPWALLFTYFFLDDSLQIHERLGSVIVSGFSFAPPFGLRRQDLGELCVTVTAGLIMLPPLLLAYYFGRPPIKKIFYNLALVLSLLVFFGVGVDMVHVVFVNNPIMSPVLAVIEDGGELLSISLFLWYALSLTRRASDAKQTLSEPTSPFEAFVRSDRVSLHATNARSDQEEFA
ncbi:hypothetical protein [Massilia consociata]